VFGLLGPNGSGKTTLLALLLEVIHPSAGSFSWFDGVGAAEARRRIGALLETPNFYPYLNADQNLSIVASIKRVANPALDGLLELVQLKERRRSAYRTYSLGMKQRLALAACLVGDPDVLILDEPTNGLDPFATRTLHEIMREKVAEGRTVFFSTHLLDQAERLCSRMAIIHRGRLAAAGSLTELRANLPPQSTLEEVFFALTGASQEEQPPHG